MSKCEVSFDEDKGCAYMCLDSNTKGLPSSFIHFDREKVSPISLDKWKASTNPGIARVRVLACRDDTIIVVTEQYNRKLTAILDKKVSTWRSRIANLNLSEERQKASWWRYISGFFIHTGRQVVYMLRCLYSSYPSIDLHGCICAACVAFNDKGDLGMQWPHTKDRSLCADMKALKNLMEYIIYKPFVSCSNLNGFSLPRDLTLFLKDLGDFSNINLNLVSLEFFLDRPTFWTGPQKMAFYDHLHELTYERKELIYAELNAAMRKRSCFNTNWDKWIRDEEYGLKGVLDHDNGKNYQHGNISRYQRNVKHHFRGKCRPYQKKMSDSAIFERLVTSCPNFYNLPSYVREGVVDCASDTGISDRHLWLWAQTQLLSSKLTMDYVPLDVCTSFQSFPLPQE